MGSVETYAAAPISTIRTSPTASRRALRRALG
jgi:hypothetical protein